MMKPNRENDVQGGLVCSHDDMRKYRHARDPRAIGGAVVTIAAVAAPAYMQFQFDDYLTWALGLALLACLLVIWLLSR